MAAPKTVIDVEKTRAFIEENFEKTALPGLMEFIRIPNMSSVFDPEWATNGLLQKAGNHIIDWFKTLNLKGMKIELLDEKGHTPMVFVEIEPTAQGSNVPTILFYGHFDKQPPCEGWKEGRGATIPVIEGDRLYGRGGADDGYSAFAAGLIVKACQDLGYPHGRIIMTFEGDEESQSADIAYWYQKYEAKIGSPELILYLDSNIGNYDTVWISNTKRGLINADLKIEILNEGVHSGEASGIVPSSFRILRQILDRIDDPKTGEVNPLFQVTVPPKRYQQAYDISHVLKDQLLTFPFVEGSHPVNPDVFHSYLNKNWKPQLSIVGQDGMPPTSVAGNVLRPQTTVKLSLRLPPTLDSIKAAADLKELCERDPPYNARVTCDNIIPAQGFNAPDMPEDVEAAINLSSLNFFEQPALYVGGGGSNPYLTFVLEQYPKAIMIPTGVLGPGANHHGPNEMLHLTYLKKLICVMTQMLVDFTHLKTQTKA